MRKKGFVVIRNEILINENGVNDSMGERVRENVRQVREYRVKITKKKHQESNTTHPGLSMRERRKKVVSINFKFFNEFICYQEGMVDALNEVLKVLKSNSEVLSDKTFNIFIHSN